jgi:hypothetical protein
MRRLARVFLTFMALTLVAGAGPQAMAAAHMDMAMATSAPASEHMPNCDHCNGDPDEAMACFAACTLPASDTVTPAVGLMPAGKAPVQPLSAWAIVATSRPPDPHPPRFPILA